MSSEAIADVTTQKEYSEHIQDKEITAMADVAAPKENSERVQHKEMTVTAENLKDLPKSPDVAEIGTENSEVCSFESTDEKIEVDQNELDKQDKSPKNMHSQSNSSGITLTGSYKQAVEMTIQRFLGKIKYSAFKSAYPVLHKERKSELKEIHQQLISQLGDRIKVETDALCDEHNVVDKLDKLEMLIDSHKDQEGKSAWRPSGNAEEDFRDHSYQEKLRFKKRLEAILANMKESKESSVQKVKENNSEIMRKAAERNKAYIRLQDVDDFMEKSLVILDSIDEVMSQTDRI